MQAEEWLHGIWIVFFIPWHLPVAAEILAAFLYPSDASRSSGVRLEKRDLAWLKLLFWSRRR